MNFVKFETDRIHECFQFVRQLKTEQQQSVSGSTSPVQLCIMATGGGAYKYYDEMKKVLGVEVLREDEMECLIMGQSHLRPASVHFGDRQAANTDDPAQLTKIPGLDFFITEIPCEVFNYSDTDPVQFAQVPNPPTDIYPYLLVNIGSGVSMIKVSGPRQYERIGGTSLGGGTLWGLLSLLTGARTFDEMLRLAENGDNTAVDMLVGDIYGTDYSKIGLKSTTIASSFGKVFKMKREAERDAEDGGGLSNEDAHHGGRGGVGHAEQHERGGFKPEDISRSLLYAIRYIP